MFLFWSFLFCFVIDLGRRQVISRIIVCFLFAGLGLGAQNPDGDPIGQQLLKQAELDRDAFGAGNLNSVTPTLEARVLRAKGDVKIQVFEARMVGPEENPALAATQTAADMFLKTAFSSSDLVAIVTATRQTSVFNSSKHDIVTEVLIKVEEVLYSKSGASVAENSNIYLARPCGVMIVGEHKVSTTDDEFPDFMIGSKYLMFLKRDARTKSYRVIDKTGVFELRGTTVKPINPIGPHPAQAFMFSSDGFVSTVRNRARELWK